MDTTKHIQTLAKLQLAALVITIVSSAFFENTLPPALQEYLQLRDTSELEGLEKLAMWPIMAFALVSIVSLVGMLQEKTWSKPAFTYSTVALYALSPALSPTVTDSITYTFDSIATLLAGMTIALLYFTPSVFTPQPNETPQENQAS